MLRSGYIMIAARSSPATYLLLSKRQSMWMVALRYSTVVLQAGAAKILALRGAHVRRSPHRSCRVVVPDVVGRPRAAARSICSVDPKPPVSASRVAAKPRSQCQGAVATIAQPPGSHPARAPGSYNSKESAATHSACVAPGTTTPLYALLEMGAQMGRQGFSMATPLQQHPTPARLVGITNVGAAHLEYRLHRRVTIAKVAELVQALPPNGVTHPLPTMTTSTCCVAWLQRPAHARILYYIWPS